VRPDASREEDTASRSGGSGDASSSSFSLEPILSWLQCDPFAGRGEKDGTEGWRSTMALKGTGRSRGSRGGGEDASGLIDPETGLRYLQITYKI
jgi:hypothetical protein